MAKTRVRVVTSQDQQFKSATRRRVVSVDENPKVASLTANEKRARRFATTSTMGFGSRTANDTVQSAGANFYSPQLSTDFLEKPQNLRERRAFYRFFYNTNEIIGQAIDIHSTLPLSKLRLVPPKGKNKHQNDYVFKFFQNMCDEMKLFKTLIEVTHEYFLFGNCLSNFAEIRVLGGYKRADQIEVNDLVLTDKGVYRKVLKRCVRPSEQILRIKSWKNFRELPVTEEHPIEIYKDGEFVFEQAGNLSLNDYIRITWPTEVVDKSHFSLDFNENYEKVENAIDEIEINNDFMYLAGYWMGDGTLARDSSRDTWGRGLWHISSKLCCKDNIEKIYDILVNIFGSDSISVWRNCDQKYLKVISNPAFIEWWADHFGETTFGKNNKKIPDWVMKLPEEKLLHFLAGMVDSDGCISTSGDLKNCIVNISLASLSVMDSVRDIALKCGIVVSYTCQKEHDVTLPSGRSTTSKNMYTVTTSDEDSCRLLTQYSIKNIPNNSYFSTMDKYWIRTDSGLAFKIRSISTEDYNDLVYNFEVDEDHTYQVAGYSTHNCFIFCEDDDWKEGLNSDNIGQKKEEAKQRAQLLKDRFDIVDKNPLYKGWKKLLILPPDQVRVRKLPLTDDVAIEYMPDPETRKFLTSDIPIDPQDPSKRLDYSISQELREKVRQSGVIPLDTDPNTGSHVYHLARKKSQYEPLGVSIIERCINTLVLMDKLRQAQTSIASRHMTPMRVVWAEELNSDDVDNLREQVDLALIDPDFSIIANYEIHWEEMGSNGRLLDVETEMESSLNRLFAGLGITREMLTGEGTYTGSRVSLEIMNTMYLLFREVLQDYIEDNLFKPIAKKKGFVEYDEYGNEVLLYPKVSFTRLAIRDNEQFFDAAFQLYQKGSISIDLILDILNIDPDATREKIEKDLFTVNDSLFNEMMRNLYTNVAAPLVEQTNIADKLAAYLKLEKTEQPAPAEGESRFSSVNDDTHKKRLAKLMKYFVNNPQAVNKIFAGNNGELLPKQASEARCIVRSQK